MQGIGRERKKQKVSRLSTLFLPLLYAPVAQLCQNISASQLYTQCPFYLLYFLTFTSKLLLILQPQPTYPFQVNHLWLLDYIRFPLRAPVGFCAFSFTSLIMYYYSYMFHFLASQWTTSSMKAEAMSVLFTMMHPALTQCRMHQLLTK